jgi:hypothetical protein
LVGFIFKVFLSSCVFDVDFLELYFIELSDTIDEYEHVFVNIDESFHGVAFSYGVEGFFCDYVLEFLELGFYGFAIVGI